MIVKKIAGACVMGFVMFASLAMAQGSCGVCVFDESKATGNEIMDNVARNKCSSIRYPACNPFGNGFCKPQGGPFICILGSSFRSQTSENNSQSSGNSSQTSNNNGQSQVGIMTEGVAANPLPARSIPTPTPPSAELRALYVRMGQLQRELADVMGQIAAFGRTRSSVRNTSPTLTRIPRSPCNNGAGCPINGPDNAQECRPTCIDREGVKHYECVPANEFPIIRVCSQ